MGQEKNIIRVTDSDSRVVEGEGARRQGVRE
jgi:hypothetical protein